jgi:hypothetical protein
MKNKKTEIYTIANAHLDTYWLWTLEETIERYSARASAITVSGLTKETDWWILSRTKINKNEKSEPKYTYIVVYSIDEELYTNQIRKAFKDEDDKFVEQLIQHLMNYTMIEPRT